MSERPDLIVKDISKSPVLEIKAAELVRSSQYLAQFTLRFPRIVKTRDDKDFRSAMQANEFAQLVQDFDQ